MLVNHDIEIDLANPGPTPRIQIKQGDAYSRNIRITLLENGQPWPIPQDCRAVFRYHAHDPETMTDVQGAFDLLEDGTVAYLFAENQLELMPANAVMAIGGLVTMDVVLVLNDWSLASFNFEIYVNRPPKAGTEAENPIASYYRVYSLETVNAELDKLRAAIEALGGTVQ